LLAGLAFLACRQAAAVPSTYARAHAGTHAPAGNMRPRIIARLYLLLSLHQMPGMLQIGCKPFPPPAPPLNTLAL